MSNQSKKTILVVDDEPALCEILADDLEEAGFNVCTAGGGHEAFEIVKTKRIDAVVSDIRMPDGDGVELLDNLKSYNSETPIVLFVSGYAEFTPEEAYNKGAEAILSKPVDPDLLVETLNQAFLPRDKGWKRESERVDTSFEVEVSLNEFESSQDARILNLGRGGMFIGIEERELSNVGDSVSFKISLDDEVIPLIEGSGIVRWKRDTGSDEFARGIGVEFISLSDECRESVIKMIDSVQTKAFIPRN